MTESSFLYALNFCPPNLIDTAGVIPFTVLYAKGTTKDLADLKDCMDSAKEIKNKNHPFGMRKNICVLL